MKYLILGAGPAGLSLACRLMQNGENDLLVIEKEAEGGGLCKSKDVDGSPLDIGGGHFLDVKKQDVLDLLFSFMDKSEWDLYERDSRIDVNGNIINSPIEANIWQMSLEDQVEYLKSIAVAGCNLGTDMPKKFVDWIYWKLGDKIADDYMIPYNKKMFGEELNALGTYWLNKLPNVSFEETLISCLEKKAYGTQPGHASFYYPKKYGYGELWKRMADSLSDKLILNTEITDIDLDTHTVNGEYNADVIISTIPWRSFKSIKGLSDVSLKGIESLKYTSVVIEYIHENLDTKAQWIYYPDPDLSYHRILVRHNFCPDSRGYWTETNLTRFKSSDRPYFINEYAYPLNTVGKEEIMSSLLKEVSGKQVYGLGRWGEWQHYNSDVVVKLAIDMADRFCS
ncbi:MAG: FAD-dependent oxidoreductase [Lachnospiraceae bacterium]|nr:FAD-dependent oxidoreductase [Lachnospiraceae bacterium]